MTNNLTTARLTALASGAKGRVPEGMDPIWSAFQRLSRARTVGPIGPNPITFSDIHAWMQITRTPLSPAHIEIIEQKDQAYLERAYRRSNVTDGVQALPPVSKEAISPALFDLGFQ